MTQICRPDPDDKLFCDSDDLQICRPDPDDPDEFIVLSYYWVDALEWLVHLDWIVEPKILIVHDDIPLKNSPDEQKKYFELLSDVSKAWYGDELGYDHDHAVYYAFPQRFSSEVKNLIK